MDFKFGCDIFSPNFLFQITRSRSRSSEGQGHQKVKVNNSNEKVTGKILFKEWLIMNNSVNKSKLFFRESKVQQSLSFFSANQTQIDRILLLKLIQFLIIHVTIQQIYNVTFT